MGKVEQAIIVQAMRFGNPIPDRIVNAPELQIGLQLYLDAFLHLDSERQSGFGPAPIPWSAIKEYAEYLKLDGEQTSDLFFFVRKMDSAHLERLQAKSQTK